jgi:putative photosynthetic complex assembly protein 2
MLTLGLPILFAIFVWWFGTGIVLLAVGLRRRPIGWIVAIATLLLVAALATIVATRDTMSAAAMYAGFTAAIVAWGWVEVLFLTGVVTGPRRTDCPPAAPGLRRVGFAIEAILYHEIALLAVGALIAFAAWGGENQIALWTYGLLWLMRLSAKLNLFHGVPVLNDGFLPEAVAHLRSYFRRRRAGALFVVSMLAAGTGLAVLLVTAAGAEEAEAVGLALVATLLALALLEHLFMILPVPLEMAWGWGMPGRGPADGADRSRPAAPARPGDTGRTEAPRAAGPAQHDLSILAAIRPSLDAPKQSVRGRP